jgi:hypothetical protein
MKKRYIFPQMEVINMVHQVAILDGSNLNHIDSKRKNFWDNSPEEWDEQQASKSNNIWEQ